MNFDCLQLDFGPDFHNVTLACISREILSANIVSIFWIPSSNMTSIRLTILKLWVALYSRIKHFAVVIFILRLTEFVISLLSGLVMDWAYSFFYIAELLLVGYDSQTKTATLLSRIKQIRLFLIGEFHRSRQQLFDE